MLARPTKLALDPRHFTLVFSLSCNRTMPETPTEVERDPLTEKVIGLAIEVHRVLGPGLLESAYEKCRCFEIRESGIPFARQIPVPVPAPQGHPYAPPKAKKSK